MTYLPLMEEVLQLQLPGLVGLSYLFYTQNIDNSLFLALIAGAIISVVSYIDDLYQLSSKLRLIVQGFVAILGLYFLGGFSNIDIWSVLSGKSTYN